MRRGQVTARQEFGAALGALAVLLLVLLAPVHAIGQLRAQTGGELSQADLVALALCAGTQQPAPDTPDGPPHKPICDSCLPGCRVLTAPPLAIGLPVNWALLSPAPAFVLPERALAPPSPWHRALPEVRGPPRG